MHILPNIGLRKQPRFMLFLADPQRHQNVQEGNTAL
jgi:hypothetical protein